MSNVHRNLILLIFFTHAAKQKKTILISRKKIYDIHKNLFGFLNIKDIERKLKIEITKKKEICSYKIIKSSSLLFVLFEKYEEIKTWSETKRKNR
jgi:hypothetical protein